MNEFRLYVPYMIMRVFWSFIAVYCVKVALFDEIRRFSSYFLHYIFSSETEIILKNLKDLSIELSSFKTVRKTWQIFNIEVDMVMFDENWAKDVALSCNIMFNNLICLKFCGQFLFKSITISKLINFCWNLTEGKLLNMHLFQKFGAS